MKINNRLIKSEVATAYLSSDITNVGAVNVPLNQIKSNTTRLTLNNNGIKIGANVKQVLISGSAFCYSGSAPYVWASINKGADSDANRVSLAIIGFVNGYASPSMAPKIIDVQEGDIIYLHKISSAGCDMRSQGNTWLTVQIIQ